MRGAERVLRLFRREPETVKAARLARDQAASQVLPGLYDLVGEAGVNCLRFSRGLSLDSEAIPHRDVVVSSTDEPNKRYVISVTSRGNNLQIADFQLKEGTERGMLFRGTAFIESLKIQKSGPFRTYEPGDIKLSQEEQIAFLKEVESAQLDIEATRELAKRVLAF